MNNIDVERSHWAYGHRPVIGFRIVRNPPRPPSELVDRFRRAFVPDISDLVGQLYTMDSAIQPLYLPMHPVVGPALTVKIAPGDNSVVKRALQMVQPGDLLVVDARGYTGCCAGGAGMLALPIAGGLAGMVVDGAWRDVTELRALDFPIYGRGVSPFSGPKRRPGEINVPVCCGGVIVHPGDIVACSEDGVVVVPHKYAQAVAAHLKEHRLRKSLEEYDLQRSARLAQERDEWFEAMFQATGGIYLDWPET